VNQDRFVEVTRGLGLELSPEQVAQFEAYEEALYQANEVMNLTRVPREECWLRHFVDSLLFHDMFPENAKVVDLGTGPGLPAWPLACARPDLRITAIDSNGKMIGFLEKQPLPNLTPLKVRIEEWDERESFDIVTGRAMAPLPAQVELSAQLCKIRGRVIPMRTSVDDALIESLKVTVLGLDLLDIERRTLPGTDAVRVFPVYFKSVRTPSRFPRAWAEIKRKPL